MMQHARRDVHAAARHGAYLGTARAHAETDGTRPVRKKTPSLGSIDILPVISATWLDGVFPAVVFSSDLHIWWVIVA